MSMVMPSQEESTKGRHSHIVFDTWLQRNGNNLYPTRGQKDELVHKSGLTYAQVARWFANRRRKLKLASAGGRSGSSGSLSSSATSPAASDLPTEPWPLPASPQKTEPEPEAWMGDKGAGRLPGPEPNLLYAAYLQHLLQAPFPLFYPPPPTDSALLMEEVLKASAKMGRPATPPATLTQPLTISTSPFPPTFPSPAPPPTWDSGLSEEESIAVSVLASFAMQKNALA